VKLDLDLMWKYLPDILAGFAVTLEICATALVAAFALGLVIALMRTSPSLILRMLGTFYVDVIRNIPFMVQVFMVFYVLPFYGLRFEAMWVGIISLTIFGAAYYGEVLRAGIASVPRGQYESGRAIGYGHLRTMWQIVLPQSVKFATPPATNHTISLIKESAILSTITVPEMTAAAARVTNLTFSPFEVYLIIAVIYWLTALCVSSAARIIEQHAKR
jgi:His/Glu/Gln/Arg/opine family amino acid ABC transporter permease subunit